MYDFDVLSYLFMEQSPEHSLDLCDIKTCLLSGPQELFSPLAKSAGFFPFWQRQELGRGLCYQTLGKELRVELGVQDHLDVWGVGIRLPHPHRAHML